MKFEILYAGTQESLNKQIEEKKADGWETRGDVVIMQPEYSGDIVTPNFVYFGQIVVKEE
jgi:hypothetical protein